MTEGPRNLSEYVLWLGLDVWIALIALGLIVFYV